MFLGLSVVKQKIIVEAVHVIAAREMGWTQHKKQSQGLVPIIKLLWQSLHPKALAFNLWVITPFTGIR